MNSADIFPAAVYSVGAVSGWLDSARGVARSGRARRGVAENLPGKGLVHKPAKEPCAGAQYYRPPKTAIQPRSVLVNMELFRHRHFMVTHRFGDRQVK